MSIISHLWSKPLWIANAELMFNKPLIQYQIFIKNLPAKSALQKTFVPCKIKMKSILKLKSSRSHNGRSQNAWETPTKGPTSTKMSDIQPATFLEFTRIYHPWFSICAKQDVPLRNSRIGAFEPPLFSTIIRGILLY